MKSIVLLWVFHFLRDKRCVNDRNTTCKKEYLKILFIFTHDVQAYRWIDRLCMDGRTDEQTENSSYC